MSLNLKGRRILLPISSFFQQTIDEEEINNGSKSPPGLSNPYISWDLMRKN